MDDRARDALRSGDLPTAIAALQEQIRKAPEDGSLRVFLFQLLAVLGQWERAATQLDVAADLDAKTLAMVQMYREAVRCELVRAAVFAGEKSPLIFGEPEQWLALLIEALLCKDPKRAVLLRAQALEAAPATAGSIDGQPFAWLADADPRLGPVCEAIINGRYYWVPYARLSSIAIEPPENLRDAVWMPVNFQFANGGEMVGLIPTRYPGSESSDDHLVALARKTTWHESPSGQHEGLGQRLLATDTDDYPLMQVRRIEFEAAAGG
jgi:type VI secretion system protein ImpE